MNYAVLWLPLAQQQLAPLLADPEIAQAVLRAAYRVDALLEYFPDLVGESRESTERVIVESPLTVYYEIDQATKVVRVLRLVAPQSDDTDSDN